MGQEPANGMSEGTMTAPTTVAEAWSKYFESGDPASREQIILQHTPLVKYVIGRLAIHLPQVLEFEDLLGYGTLGLIQAFERFDPSRGVKFESYAVMRIRGAILDALRSLRGLPQSATDKAKRLQRTALELESTLGRPPTDEELAEALNISTEQLNQQIIDASWVTVSLDSIIDNQADADIRSLTSQRAEDDVVGMVERRELVAELAEALTTLTERERLILSLYYHDELTMREIGQVLEISEGRVCQLHARALHKLRVAMAKRVPEFFERKWGQVA
jgi:RNA polymerase sigma factor for flagellar operon FliA